MLRYLVLKPFDWEGRPLKPGEVVDIGEGDRHIYGLVRAKFIREVAPPGEALEFKVIPRAAAAAPLIVTKPSEAVRQMAAEMAQPTAIGRQDPKAIVEAAKAKAAAIAV